VVKTKAQKIGKTAHIEREEGGGEEGGEPTVGLA
jgi:hypothetical protein